MSPAVAPTFPRTPASFPGLSLLWAAAVRMAAPDDEPGRSPPAGLIGLLRKRDPEAWNDLFLVEHPAIYRYALSRLGDPAEAEDATSHVFTEAWEHAEALEDQGLPARAWLFGIARNVVNSRRRRWLQRPPALTLEAFDQPTHDLSTSPEMLDLAGAITALDHAHSEVITLRFIHGLSLQETAVALGTSVDAIKGRQARALAQLRKRVEVPPEE